MSDSKVVIIFHPKTKGVFFLHILYDGKPIKSSPFLITVTSENAQISPSGLAIDFVIIANHNKTKLVGGFGITPEHQRIRAFGKSDENFLGEIF